MKKTNDDIIYVRITWWKLVLEFAKENLIYCVNVVIVPLLIGGKEVSILIDGDDIT